MEKVGVDEVSFLWTELYQSGELLKRAVKEINPDGRIYKLSLPSTQPFVRPIVRNVKKRLTPTRVGSIAVRCPRSIPGCSRNINQAESVEQVQ